MSVDLDSLKGDVITRARILPTSGWYVFDSEHVIDRLALSMRSGVTVYVYDSMKKCCEKRRMTTDDDPSDLVGSELRGIEVSYGPKPTDEDLDSYECHEEAFVRVIASKAAITLCTHNEHNGFYGGFDLCVCVEQSIE